MGIEEQQYKSGFNKGYLLARHQPELFNDISKALKTENAYINGFKDGGIEYAKDKSTPIKNLSQHKSPSKDRERDIEKDQ